MLSMVLRLLLLGAVSFSDVSGHGRMIEPPSRASMWRYGFKTPPNYDDNQSFCGGLTRLEENNGKCGVCGDPWDMETPRPHEAGGEYATNKIVRRYTTGGTIQVKIELTANHKGYFEFRVCPAPEQPGVEVTDECLEKNILIGEDGQTKYYPDHENKVFEMNYRLPDGMTCDRCVLQWKYVAGNNWEKCEDGTEKLGCGIQEQFRACADIAIVTDKDQPSKRTYNYDLDKDYPGYQYDDVDDDDDDDDDNDDDDER